MPGRQSTLVVVLLLAAVVLRVDCGVPEGVDLQGSWMVGGRAVWPVGKDGTLKIPRLLLVPAAVAPILGPNGPRLRTFHAYSGGGFCFSSFLTASATAVSFLGGGTTPEDIEVDVVTLEELLERIPTRMEISLLKVDAQGFDLSVVLSAGLHIRRIARIQVECQDVPSGDSGLLYEGQPTKDDIVTSLRAAGFVLERCWDNNPILKEQNCVFARFDLRLNVRDDCFEPYWDSVQQMEAAIGPAIPENAAQIAFRGPKEMRDYNAAKWMEMICCRTPLTPGLAEPCDLCFNEVYIYEECCLRAYFEAIDYIRDWNRFSLQEMWGLNSTRVHYVFNTGGDLGVP